VEAAATGPSGAAALLPDAGAQGFAPVLVHNGSIARMPADGTNPIDDGEEVEGYLVEIQGLQGASGSSVYIRPTIEFNANERTKERREPNIVERQRRRTHKQQGDMTRSVLNWGLCFRSFDVERKRLERFAAGDLLVRCL